MINIPDKLKYVDTNEKSFSINVCKNSFHGVKICFIYEALGSNHSYFCQTIMHLHLGYYTYPVLTNLIQLGTSSGTSAITSAITSTSIVLLLSRDINLFASSSSSLVQTSSEVCKA